LTKALRLIPESERFDMRSFILACIAVAVIATASAAVLSVFQESAAAAFSTEAADLSSITGAMTTSKTLSPHQIHLNYQGMKELPVQECGPTAY
jgi:hypothetical protein